jgi:DNA-directed RNA polymerase specialized sigma subunit
MNVTSLSQIEKNISMLPRDEQMLLVERIIHRLRKRNIEEESNIESQLAIMASDPDIQKELGKINKEFASTELDGLEKY